MKPKMYTFFSDPGHAWLKVPRAEIHDLGIRSTISHYSYQKGAFVYLEEDCDAPKFIRAKEARGELVTFHERNANRSSKIRSYDSYKVEV